MTKLFRAVLIFVCGIITLALLCSIIPQFNFAQIDKNILLIFFIIIGLSFSLILLSFLLKGYLNLILFVVSYMLSSASSVGLVYYTVLADGKDYDLFPFVILIMGVGFANILCELYMRKKLRLLAAGCMSGKRLNDYAKHPWFYIDKKSNKSLFILYFDVPELSKWALSKQTQDVKKVEQNILDIIIQKTGEHDGVLVRKSEDSAIIVFEVTPKLKVKSFDTAECYSAYHALLCALELKAAVDGLKETHSQVNLKGRAVIIKDTGILISHIRFGRMEISLFSDGLYRASEILRQSVEDEIICDTQVYDLCSNQFAGKKIAKKEVYQVQGLSVHSEYGL